MFNFHVTTALALATLRSIVDEFGADHMGTLAYGGCAYVDEHSPADHLKSSCIVGKAFDRWGILRVLLNSGGACGVNVKSINQAQAGAFGVHLRTELADKFGITFDDEAYWLLKNAQVSQDSSNPWGHAVEHAAQSVLNDRLGGENGTAVERLASLL